MISARLAGQVENYRRLGVTVDPAEVDHLEDDESTLLVLPHARAPMQEIITSLTLPDRSVAGIFDKNFEDPDRYRPVDETVPAAAYLIRGFEPGTEYLNLPPRDAVPLIAARGRTPATIEEGLAAFVHDRSVLQRNKCYSLAGSTRGDKRVPALWISKNAPKLGWCFAGAPHTWLGTASVAQRRYARSHT